MAEYVTIDESVEGNRVIDTEGGRIGVVCGVSDGVVYVDPDPGLAETITSKPGWRDVYEDYYPLPGASIERITAEEVHLSENL